jgi:hypothetical protein
MEMNAHVQIVPKCQNCGNPLRGRIDKKFCDIGCKNEHNNRLQRDERMAISQIDAILKRNRRLLKRCLGGEQSKIVRAVELTNAGLRLDFYTHHYMNRDGDKYIFCYDYGYLILDGGNCLMVKHRGQTAHAAAKITGQNG